MGFAWWTALQCCQARERDTDAQVIEVDQAGSKPLKLSAAQCFPVSFETPEGDMLRESMWSSYTIRRISSTMSDVSYGSCDSCPRFCSCDSLDIASDNSWVAEVIRAAQENMPECKISEDTLSWCTPEHVKIYWLARQGDVEKAGAILAEALRWREQYADILCGRRVPSFNAGDFRVVAVGESGRPIVYFCFANQQRASVKVW
jgi:hypothetical protein